MTTELMTTIKVPKDLRDRISRDAALAGLTAAGFLGALLAEHERAARFDSVRQAYATAPDAEYLIETAQWDKLASAGPDQ
jgi:hypothetical protein